MKDKTDSDIIQDFYKMHGYDENGKRPTGQYKKYIVFQYSEYYPSGGLGDVNGSFDELEQAIKFIKENCVDYGEIVDRDTWELVWDQDAEEN